VQKSVLLHRATESSCSKSVEQKVRPQCAGATLQKVQWMRHLRAQSDSQFVLYMQRTAADPVADEELAGIYQSTHTHTNTLEAVFVSTYSLHLQQHNKFFQIPSSFLLFIF
jgi:hypothetical protein